MPSGPVNGTKALRACPPLAPEFNFGYLSRMEKRENRFHIMFTPTEMAALDDWRAKEQIWSRADAVRRLVAEGIKRPLPAPSKAP